MDSEEKIEITLRTTSHDAGWVVKLLNLYCASKPQGEAFEAHAFVTALSNAGWIPVGDEPRR